MTTVDFYFDPSCPFCWITSRWLLQASENRDINIIWRQFSLALKNGTVTPKDGEDEHALGARRAHRAHRVLYQAVVEHNAPLIELYSEFGIRHFIMERDYDDAVIRDVLAANNLPDTPLAAADDDSLDAKLQAELDSAIDAAGDSIGVPTIVFTDKDGKRVGYFGPVLNELPEQLDESLAIWDGLEKLATTSSFYELKRSRAGGDPNVFSAARCSMTINLSRKLPGRSAANHQQ